MPAEVLERAGSYSSYNEEGGQEEEEADVEASIFEQYLSVCDQGTVDPETDALFAKGLLRVQQYLAGGRDNTTCPICLGGIRPTEAIWACGKSCFALFHMTCIQEWARNQLDTAAYKASRDPSAAAAAREWGCPSCRFDYPASEVPQQYSCFCGKKEDPEWDPWLAPHSCGELCGKSLPGSCTHSCLLLCHPGPCPPCPLLVDASCHCGKAVMKQRCGNNEFSCRGVCGKQLSCGHKCPDTCHAGPCAPCQVVVAAQCACREQQQQRLCHLSVWRCEKTCGKLLACGRHHCDQVCHSGPCGPCPEEGERHCPCGKAVYPNLKCDEQAPLCGGTCGKVLDCGVHTCQERCHYGHCNKVCRELVSKPCRCGRSTKQVLCSADVRCDSKCNNMKACDRHPCKRRCCDGNCPPCEEVCNRKLRCGNHRCPATCHRGPCRPCPLSQTISCACGKTSYTLPCGAEAAAAPPRCNKACPVPPVCRHAADAKPHRCHFGPCPPCRSPCGTALACGHTCSSSTCHDRQSPAVAQFERPRPPKSHAAAAAAAAANGNSSSSSGSGGDSKRGGSGAAAATDLPPPPAVVAAAAAAALAAAGLGPCPACPVPVSVGCLGGHCQAALPCSTAAAFCCGAPCGRPLSCGNHSCSKPCHAVRTPAVGAAAGPAVAGAGVAAVAEACEVCERPCVKPRACSHPCPSTCHPGPCTPCEVSVVIECYCGRTDLTFPCCEQQQITQQQQQQQSGRGSSAAGGAGCDPLCCGQVCNRELPYCPHLCSARCHAGDCPAGHTCAEEVTVRCSCRRQKDKWKCAQVQAALAAAAAAGGGGSTGSSRLYDGSTALKLLQCDAACAAAGKEKQQQQQQQQQPAAAPGSSGDGSPARGRGNSSSGTVKQEQQQVAATAAAAPAPIAAAAVKGTKKLSRAEREALAAAKEAERLKQQRQQQIRQAGILAGVFLLVLVVGFALAVGLERLLAAMKAVDRTLQEKYGNAEL